MLALRKPVAAPAASCSPNLLPCRIHHDGPVDAAVRFWAPVFPGRGGRCGDGDDAGARAEAGSAVNDASAGSANNDAGSAVNEAGSVSDVATPTAYFRGRKLRGKRVAVPEGWRGVVVQRAERTIGGQDGKMAQVDVDEEEEPEEETGVMEEVGRFGEVVVWGQEGVGEEEDAYARGLGEWVAFAGVMHSTTAMRSS